MEYIDNSLCATKMELVPSIMTGTNLQNLILRKQVKIVVRGCRGRLAQYAVDSLPKKYREECYRRFDIPPMPRVKSRLEELISPYPEAVKYYHAYRLPDGRCLPQERIAQYTAEAQILVAGWWTRWKQYPQRNTPTSSHKAPIISSASMHATRRRGWIV